MSYGTDPVLDAERYMSERAAASAEWEAAYGHAYDDFMDAVRQVGRSRSPLPSAVSNLIRNELIDATAEGEPTLHMDVTTLLCRAACGDDMRSEVYELMVFMAHRYAEWKANRT